MKIITAIILSIFFAHALYSQYGDYQTPFTGRLTSGDVSNMDFYAYNSNIVWICGDSGVVFKTSNPWGNPPSFRYVNNGLSNQLMLKTMCAIDTNTALVAGNIGANTYVYRTSNSGLNWAPVFIQPNGFINSIWFKSPTIGFMAGNPVGRWSLWRTTNGGVSWDSTGRYLPQAGSEQGFANSMRLGGDSIWMGTNNSRIYFSSNHGLTWAVKTTGSHQNTYAIYFWAPNQAYAGSDSLLQSVDWGMTWTVVPNTPGTGIFSGLVGGNPGVDSYGGPVFYSRSERLYYNISNPWVLFPTTNSGTFTYLFKARERSSGNSFSYSTMIGLRANGVVWICNCAWGGITTIGNNIPSEFMLHQNYPNPFNPATKIRFDVPVQSAGNVKLAVYDILGNKVVMLVNEHLAAGTYEAEFDGSNISSGLYFYKFEAGNYTETKKMLLVK